MSQGNDPWDGLFDPPSASTREKKRKNTSSLYRPQDSSYIDDPSIWKCIKPAMEALIGGSIFYFDSRGDLTLKVGGSSNEKLQVYEFVVCSRSLARWSSVFRAMLFTGFSESRPKDNSPWTIEMPEDSVSPVFLVLSIVHGHFQHIPKRLEQDHLYQLLVVTEKYDMTQTLSPWASTWFQPYAATKTSEIEGKEVVMWISWELGHEETFRTYAKELLLKSKINGVGELLDGNGIALSTYTFLEPPGILETIASTRAIVINEMTRTIYDAIEGALKNGKCERLDNNGNGYYGNYGDYKRPMTPDQCIRCVLGSLIQQVHKIGLQDVALLQTATPKYLGSINDLLSAIKSIKFSLSDPNHNICNPLQNIKDKATSLVAKIESPVTDNHLEYLRAQAKKTGKVTTMVSESPDADQYGYHDTDDMWQFLKQKATSPTAEIFSAYAGDLTLVVGPPPQPGHQPDEDTMSVPSNHQSRRFRVDSNTMATISDVFDRMLFGGFAESKPAAGPWVVSLPEDNPWAMFFIVANAHGHASYIPDRLTADELLEVLNLMEKYAVKTILADWLQKWISECPDHLSLCQDVAWLIGHEKIFTDHVKAYCENARLNVRGDLVNQWSLIPCYYASLQGFDQEG
ncbi:nuclear pore protein-like protein [Colletotrichum camelliae]|nr:nuclear pore protein-like protein [Colletotrichum camelliae]